MTLGGSTQVSVHASSHSAVAVPLTFNIANLTVPMFGLYRFDLRVDDDEAISVEAEVLPIVWPSCSRGEIPKGFRRP